MTTKKHCTDCGARPGMCSSCEGDGGTDWIDCETCDGTGACQSCSPNKDIPPHLIGQIPIPGPRWLFVAISDAPCKLCKPLYDVYERLQESGDKS